MRISDWSSDVCSSDLHGGLADADRHALALLAAGADAVVELHVVADHLHLGHHIGAVADEGGALHRRAHLAVLDEVGLGAGEHELARGDVDLAAAEVHGIEALLRSEEHTSELQSLMRTSYAVFCLKKKK